MKLFNLFTNHRKYLLPETYKGIISEKDYDFTIKTAIQYHKEAGLNIVRITDGEIVTEVNGEEQHRYLDNLVRLLSSYEKTSWKDLIYEHFDKLKDNSAAYAFFYKDFEHAAPLLRVLIKPEDFILSGSISEFVGRVDFPQTLTFLVIEFEGQFQFVRRESIAEWPKTQEELFEIALSNLPADEIEVKEYLYCDKYTVFTFFSGDYSSALMLDLRNRADFAIGKHGSLVAIPTKGTTFVHPIESEDVLGLIETIHPLVQKFYHEDPGCITTNFYWFYEGEFQIFPLEQNEDGTSIAMPEKLLSLLQ